MFREVDIKVQSVSDTLGTRNTGQPLEKLVQTQALSLDLREAVIEFGRHHRDRAADGRTYESIDHQDL